MGYNNLGTRWKFKEYRAKDRINKIYGISVGDTKYRIAPDDSEPDKWRIDKADNMTLMGGPWVALSWEKFKSPQEAAKKLVRLHGKAAMEKRASVGTEVFHKFVDTRKFVTIQRNLKGANDEQSVKLLGQIMRHFVAKFELKSGEEDAWHRLLNMVWAGANWDPSLLRNNVFKIANSLGMKLPSGMFASHTDLEREWGPTLKEGSPNINRK